MMPPMWLLPSVVNQRLDIRACAATADCGGLTEQDTASSGDDVGAMAEVTWWLNLQNSATLRVSLAGVELLWVQRHVR